MYEQEIFNKNPGLVIATIIFVVIILGLAGNADMQDQIDQQEWYCENVEIWKESDGRNGHPDYKGIDCEAIV